MSYTSLHLAQRPKRDIDDETFSLKTQPIPSEASLKPGELLIRISHMSVDPAARGWLNDTRSYLPPVQIGAIMRGASVAQVICSKAQKTQLKRGDWVVAGSGWTEYAVIDEKSAQPIQIPRDSGLHPKDFIGILGMTSLTAYFGMLDCGRLADLKAGSTVVVSGAAGATGIVAGQIAKIYGHRVVGIAGGSAKCSYIKSIGFDEAADYKSPSFFKDLVMATPNYINLFFDNVGGEILDACLRRAALKSVFVICGAISQYNTAPSDTTGPKYYTNIISQRIRMEGFIVFDYASQYEKARKDLGEWLRDGKLKKEEYVVKGGLSQASRAMGDLFKGRNTGKMLVEVTPPSEELKTAFLNNSKL